MFCSGLQDSSHFILATFSSCLLQDVCHSHEMLETVEVGKLKQGRSDNFFHLVERRVTIEDTIVDCLEKVILRISLLSKVSCKPDLVSLLPRGYRDVSTPGNGLSLEFSGSV